MRFRFSLFSLFIFLFFGINAQTNLDSFQAIWQDIEQTDSIRFDAIEKVIKGFSYNSIDSSLFYANQMYNEAERLGLKKYQGDALHRIAFCYWVWSDFPKMEESLEKSFTYAKEIGDQHGIARYYAFMGDIKNFFGKQDSAQLFLNKSLELAEEYNYPDIEVYSLLIMAQVYNTQGKKLKELNNYKKAKPLLESLRQNANIAYCLASISGIYQYVGDLSNANKNIDQAIKAVENTGDNYLYAQLLIQKGYLQIELNMLPEALTCFKQSIEVSESYGDRSIDAAAYRGIGIVHQSLSEFDIARQYFEESLDLCRELDNKTGIAQSMINLGEVWQPLNDISKSIKYCQDGLKLSEEITLIQSQSDACKCLYQAYKAKNYGIRAIEYHDRFLMLEESLNQVEVSKTVQLMDFEKQALSDSLKQEEEKLKLEIAHKEEVMQKDKMRNILFGSGIMLLILAGGIYSRLHFVRKSKATLQVEKDRSENLLLNILPVEIAEELKLKGSADPRGFDQVSIIFTDFKDFTSQSEKLSAKDLVNEINQCFKAFDHICEKHKIEKIKTIGDAYMAVGGLPIPADDSATNTVLAALEFQEFISRRKKEQDAKGLPAFEMRVGIHTGHVVAGIVGVKKFQYDIWGDTVNTASRIESKGEVGKVNISQTTYDLIKDDPDFTFDHRGKIQAKGKGEIEMYFVNLR